MIRDFHFCLPQVDLLHPNPYKCPACALELALTGHVVLVLFRAVPLITIALDRQLCIDSIHHQVDPLFGNLYLRTNSELPTK